MKNSDVYDISISTKAIKALQKVPSYIAEKLYIWVDQVSSLGLREVRKIKSYHDEPLKGKRKGQRSVRLNKAYRAIYDIQTDQTIRFVCVQEVNKHDY